MNEKKMNPYVYVPENVQITYEVSHNEPLHPDPQVASRMMEVALSKCDFGCKVYADPWSNVRVVAHNRTYGCLK